MGLYFNIASFVFCILVVILFSFIVKSNEIKKSIIIIILISCVFFLYTKFLENRYDNSFLRNEKLVVKIISDKEIGNYYNKYEGRVINKNLKILIYIKNIEFEYGDIVEISGEISKPDKARNKYGFDYSQYLRQKKISGIILVKKYKKIGINKDCFYYLYKIKNLFMQRINSMYNAKEAGFLNAILFGKTNNLDEKVKENFKLSNLSHILAISGMHIAYVVLGVEKVLKTFIKNIKIKNFCLIIFLILFMFLVGASTSVIRACIMVIISYIAKIFLQKEDFYSSFCIALLILLIINPYNINSVSMWLSFGGSLGIVVFNKFLSKVILRKIKKRTNKFIINIIEIALVSISAQIIIFPIMLYFFNTISISFWISNILISFFVPPILILGYLNVFLFPIGKIIVYFEKILIKSAFLIAQICAKIPFNQIFMPTPKLYLVILYYVLIFYLVYKFNKNRFYYIRKFLSKKIIIKYIKKFLCLMIILVIIFNIFKFIPKDLKINFLDVGQGDCTLIRTRENKVILIDSGEGNTDKYDYGEKVVFPYLLDNGIMKIDYMIISHFDSDHCRWNVLYFRKYEG